MLIADKHYNNILPPNARNLSMRQKTTEAIHSLLPYMQLVNNREVKHYWYFSVPYSKTGLLLMSKGTLHMALGPFVGIH